MKEKQIQEIKIPQVHVLLPDARRRLLSYARHGSLPCNMPKHSVTLPLFFLVKLEIFMTLL